MDPQVLVQLSEPRPAYVEPLLAACTEGMRSGRCLLTEDDASSSQARAVAILTTTDREGGRIRIEVGLRGTPPRWLERTLTFSAQDEPRERWRAAGFTVATLVGDLESDPSAGVASELSPTTRTKPAEVPAPGRTTPGDERPAQPPRSAPQPPKAPAKAASAPAASPAPPPSRVSSASTPSSWALRASLQGSTGFGSGLGALDPRRPGIGVGLVRLLPERGAYVAGRVAYSEQDFGPEPLQISFVEVWAGAGLRGRLGLGELQGSLGGLLGMMVLSAQGKGLHAANGWLPGLGVDAGVAWPLARGWDLTLDGSTIAYRRHVDLSVDGQERGDLSWLQLGLGLGLQYRW